MPGGSKKAADAALVTHLAAGVSPAGAAKLAGVSEATTYRRLADPAFLQRVEKACSDFWDRALGVMSKGVAESAIVLRKLLRSDDGRIKLQAAKTLLEQGIKVRDLVDIARRFEELEKLAQAKGTTMNRRRLDALESAFAAMREPVCRCLLSYQASEPMPPLTGICPKCGLPRRGGNLIIEEVVIESREEAETFAVAEREGR
jgi:hypothetical protein